MKPIGVFFKMQHRRVVFGLRLAPHFFSKCYFEFHETCLNVGQQFPKQLKETTLQLHNFATCSEFPCFNLLFSCCTIRDLYKYIVTHELDESQDIVTESDYIYIPTNLQHF